MIKFKQFLSEYGDSALPFGSASRDRDDSLKIATKKPLRKTKSPKTKKISGKPILLYHGGPKKENFDFSPRAVGDDGYGHYLIDNKERSAYYGINNHVHHVEMHIDHENIANLDEKSDHKSQPAGIHDAFEKVKRKVYGDRYDTEEKKKEKEKYWGMQGEISNMGIHLNSLSAKSRGNIHGHKIVADLLHKHGIHAGTGEYPLGGKGSKNAKCYCVYGKARKQLKVVAVEPAAKERVRKKK